jgi:hypothetical protein
VKLYGPHAVWKDVGQRLLDERLAGPDGPSRGGRMLASPEAVTHVQREFANQAAAPSLLRCCSKSRRAPSIAVLLA